MARGEEWLWHVLALALGGRTVAEWKAAMGDQEFQRWAEFYQAWPFDDYHRFHRPAALIAGAMASGDDPEDTMRKRLEWLQPSAAEKPKHTQADIDIFRAAGRRV
ncbi:hypothetical protein PAN31117_03104 [Pandoraea anapnoica]|uniref:Minor tail T domain-containing protein n=1 Tax=Pandoraea anapnoica TaxID=2508301 RepID=A0A5E5A5D9_9BURK|nr:hypothetical protein [Pandoraea anapnoica]VVE68871.1 hypothetical protein PAN31117_03104 [Pandoraea anapnoica]